LESLVDICSAFLFPLSIYGWLDTCGDSICVYILGGKVGSDLNGDCDCCVGIGDIVGIVIEEVLEGVDI
jgi:hypothetical protein